MFTLTLGLTSATKAAPFGHYYYVTYSAYDNGDCGGIMAYTWKVDMYNQITLVNAMVWSTNCPPSSQN